MAVASLSRSADQVLDLARVGEASPVVLREDQPAINVDVEDAPLAPNQFRVDAELLLEGGGQTGRPRQIVSRDTPGDGDVHRNLRASTIGRVPGISNVP